MDDMAHSNKDIEYHDDVASEYDRVVLVPRALGTSALFAGLQACLPVQRDAMLDLGAGTGQMSLMVGSEFRHVTAVDHSRGMLDVAKRNLEKASLRNVEFVIADAFEFLRNESRRFDLITCVGFLHHVEVARLNELFLSVAAHLAADGVFIFAEPTVTAAREPRLIRWWNAEFRGDPARYSAQTSEDPDEAPLDFTALRSACDLAGLRRVHERTGWEIFPRTGVWKKLNRTLIRALDLITRGGGPIYWAACTKT